MNKMEFDESMEKLIIDIAKVLKKHHIMFFIDCDEDIIKITYAKNGR